MVDKQEMGDHASLFPPASTSETAPGSRIAVAYKACVLATAIVALGFLASLWHLGNNSMIACGFFGAALIHLGARPPARHLMRAVMGGTAFAAWYLLAGGVFGSTILVAALGAGAFLGLGSLAVMTGDLVWRERPAYRDALGHALALPVFSFVAGIGMGLFNGTAQPTYDYLLYAFDSALGLSPGQSIASLFERAPWIANAASVTYSSLLVFPPLYHAWMRSRGVGSRVDLMKAFVVAGLCGFALYQICPGEGPLYAFGAKFPRALPAAGALRLQSYLDAGVHNAMPSMHMTWALLVWWSAWEIGAWALGAASLFVSLTFLATLGFGEHYFVDLLASVPLALLVQGICAKNRPRIAAGLLLSIGWTVIARIGVPAHLPIAANWALVLATLGIAGALQLPEAARALVGSRHRPPAAKFS